MSEFKNDDDMAEETGEGIIERTLQGPMNGLVESICDFVNRTKTLPAHITVVISGDSHNHGFVYMIGNCVAPDCCAGDLKIASEAERTTPPTPAPLTKPH